MRYWLLSDAEIQNDPPMQTGQDTTGTARGRDSQKVVANPTDAPSLSEKCPTLRVQESHAGTNGQQVAKRNSMALLPS